MKGVGVAGSEAAKRFPTHAYFGDDKGELRFNRNTVLRTEKLKAYFGKPKAALKKQFENAMAKGVRASMGPPPRDPPTCTSWACEPPWDPLHGTRLHAQASARR